MTNITVIMSMYPPGGPSFDIEQNQDIPNYDVKEMASIEIRAQLPEHKFSDDRMDKIRWMEDFMFMLCNTDEEIVNTFKDVKKARCYANSINPDRQFRLVNFHHEPIGKLPFSPVSYCWNCQKRRVFFPINYDTIKKIPNLWTTRFIFTFARKSTELTDVSIIQSLNLVNTDQIAGVKLMHSADSILSLEINKRYRSRKFACCVVQCYSKY